MQNRQFVFAPQTCNFLSGALGWSRTTGLSLRRGTLYPLSYKRVFLTPHTPNEALILSSCATFANWHQIFTRVSI